MSFEKYLTGFFDKIQSDARIGPTQVCLYTVLVCQWGRNQNVNPFQIHRAEVMQMTKISSRDTFSKSMKLLHDAGYIRYIPSYNPVVASMVWINNIF